jgi:hypothetical protein
MAMADNLNESPEERARKRMLQMLKRRKLEGYNSLPEQEQHVISSMAASIVVEELRRKL